MNPLASYQCARRLLMALAAISSIVLAVGCGGSSGPTPNNNGFSNSSLSGTYVLAVSGTDVNAKAASESFFAIVGTITADGNGNITTSMTQTSVPLACFPAYPSPQANTASPKTVVAPVRWRLRRETLVLISFSPRPVTR